MSWSDEFLTAAIEERARKLTPPDLAEEIMARARAESPVSASAPVATEANAVASARATNTRARLATAAVLLLAAAAVVGVWRTSRGESGAGESEAGESGAGEAQANEAQAPNTWLPLQRGAVWHYQAVSPDGQWEFAERVVGSARRDGRDYHLLVTTSADPDHVEPLRLLACDDRGVWQDQTLELLLSHSAPPASRCLLAAPLREGQSWRWTYESLKGFVQFHGQVVSTGESCTVPAGQFRAAHLRTTITRDGLEQVEDLWYARGVGLVRKTTTRAGKQVADAQLTRHEKGRSPWNPVLSFPERLAKSEFHELGMPDETQVVPLGLAGLFVDSAFVRARYGEQWRIWRMTREHLMVFEPKDMADWNLLVGDEGLFVSPKDQHREVAGHLAGLAGRLFAAGAGGHSTRDPVITNWTSFVEKDGRATVNLKTVQGFQAGGKTVGMKWNVVVRRGQVLKVQAVE